MLTDVRLDLEPDHRTDDGAVGIDDAEAFTDDHPRLVAAARIGWAAKGVVYAVVGILSMLIAARPFGTSGSGEASQSGAVATVAQQPFGALLLVALAIGLVTFAGWRFVSIALPAANDSHTWITRVAYAGSALVYLALAWTAVSFAVSPGDPSTSETSRVEEVTSAVMERTGGRWLIGVVGLGLLVAAAVFANRARTADFAAQLRAHPVGPLSHRRLVQLGQVGWVGRAAMMGLIGFFLLRAAWQYDPDEASGLDGALRDATDSTVGMAVALAVAIGLFAYGVFCVLSAPDRLLVAADEG